jgi:hypothetical protein
MLPMIVVGIIIEKNTTIADMIISIVAVTPMPNSLGTKVNRKGYNYEMFFSSDALFPIPRSSI